jgi:hypothetical protein
MRVVVSSRKVQTTVRSDFRLPSYEYLPIDRWGGGTAAQTQSYGLDTQANFGKNKRQGGGAHTSEKGLILFLTKAISNQGTKRTPYSAHRSN